MNASTSCKEHDHHHMPPGSHGPPPTGVGKKGMAKDPICGMVVPKATALSTQRGGRDYYFCSQTCLQTFRNPDRELRVMRPGSVETSEQEDVLISYEGLKR